MAFSYNNFNNIKRILAYDAVFFSLNFIFVILLGVIDHLSGYEISFSLFYLFPILIVAWHKAIFPASLFSVISAGIWLFADLSSGHIYSYYLIPIWNMLMRLAFYIIIVYFASRLKKDLLLEKKLSRTDILTELYNSRAFFETSSIELKRALRFNRPLSLAYIDVDNFKSVNDNFGHDTGDYLLQVLSKTLKDNLRGYDIIARLGGDEFIIMFPETDEHNVQLVINKLRQSLLEASQRITKFVTISIGVVTFIRMPLSIQEGIREADNVMYSAKKSGKNTVKYKIIK